MPFHSTSRFIIDGTGQLKEIVAAAARFNGQLERQAERVAERRQRRQQYEAIVSSLGSSSPAVRDQLVAKQLVATALSGRGSNQLSDQEFMQAFKVLTASPVAQQMKREQGKDAATDYLVEVLNEAMETVERTNVDGVAETVLRGIAPELLERARDRIARVKASELSAETGQAPAKRQGQPRQRQKQLAKKRDQEIEM